MANSMYDLHVHSFTYPADVARVKHLAVGQHNPTADPENPDMLIKKISQV